MRWWILIHRDTKQLLKGPEYMSRLDAVEKNRHLRKASAGFLHWVTMTLA